MESLARLRAQRPIFQARLADRGVEAESAHHGVYMSGGCYYRDGNRGTAIHTPRLLLDVLYCLWTKMILRLAR